MSASQLALAQQHLQAGRFDQARVMLTRLAAASPNDLGVNTAMAVVLVRLMEHERARYFAEKAVAIDPRSPAARVNLGNILYYLGAPAEARAHFEAGLAADASHLGCRRGLAKTLLMLGLPGQAELAVQEGLQRHARDRDLRLVRADALLELGRPDEALAVARGLAAERPSDADALRSVAFISNYAPGAGPAHTLDAHRRAAAAIAGPANAPRPRLGSVEGRSITVGVLSSDLRDHSVAHFARALVLGLDSEGFRVCCYFNAPAQDRVTDAFKRRAAVFRTVFARPAAETASRIRSDGVDVLFDLAGLTHGQTLGVLALRPAPLLVTAIGYPNTTGLPAVDLRLVDSLTDPAPPDPAHECLTERPLRLDPCFLCYTPPDDAPEPARAPGRPITFGSFNTAAKLNDAVISLWASIAASTPGARLLLKGRTLGDPAARAALAARFAAAGLDGSRLDLAAQTPSTAEHLALYASVDVALDPFPYHGTTTSCEALWMGVPVVTLAGPEEPGRHAGRVGVSLLSAAGVPGWIARTPEAYARIARDLASDPGGLDEQRRTLRARVAGSRLCDRAAYARRLGGAILEALRSLPDHDA